MINSIVADVRDGAVKRFANYYKVLQVNRFASPSEVRASFRRLAKIHHPDLRRDEREEAHARMRVIIEAYRILIDSRKRAIYDLRFRGRLERDGNGGLRERLEKKAHDPYARAHLVLYDLVNSRPAAALDNYERLAKGNGNGGGGGADRLLSLLGYADCLDCLFLLAEAYQNRSRFRASLEHYETALREDLKWNYFRDFRKEILARIRNLYVRHLARDAVPAEAIGYYRRFLEDYDPPRGEKAFLNKKIAEAYLSLRSIDKAREHLAEAFRLKPNLAGVKKISRIIGYGREAGQG